MMYFLLSLLCFLVNIPLGYIRSGAVKFSAKWFIAVHAAVPIIAGVRILSGISSKYIPLFVLLAVLGQLAGGVARKKIAAKRLTPP